MRPPPPLRNEKSSSRASGSSVADTIASAKPANSRISTSTLRSERRRQMANPITAALATRPATRMAESSMEEPDGRRPERGPYRTESPGAVFHLVPWPVLPSWR